MSAAATLLLLTYAETIDAVSSMKLVEALVSLIARSSPRL
jgi:hypothetical protein